MTDAETGKDVVMNEGDSIADKDPVGNAREVSLGSSRIVSRTRRHGCPQSAAR